MAKTEHNKIIFTGFDSAWGSRNDGAICDLALKGDGSLELSSEPFVADWDDAIAYAAKTEQADLHVWAIDQPICVGNLAGCRPVERDLARALMSGFGCGAHSSNLGNPCWQPGAGIWKFVCALENSNYIHNPMAIPAAESGGYYFECYPHPALLGLFDLDGLVKYKIRHRNADGWKEIIELLLSLANSDLPISNIGDFVKGLPRNKANEDKLDAIISAYTAAYWWKFGTERSTMIGDLATGYIVTPHSCRTYASFAGVFDGRMNLEGPAVGPRHAGTSPGPHAGTDALPVEPANGWSGLVELKATDTTNIWRNSQGTEINSWMEPDCMEGWRLWVRFIDEDGEPAVLFLPFENQGNQQGGMRASPQQMNRVLWSSMVADAVRINPICFQVCYCYKQIQ